MTQQFSEIQKWPKRKLGDLIERVSKPVDVSDDSEYREIGIRSHCKGIFHKQATMGKEIGSKRVFWIEPGCLVLNIVFAWEQAVALTTDRERGMIASHRFPMYRSRNGELLPEYACLYFSSPRGKYDLGIASPGGAGRNKTLGQEEFKRLEVPLPPLGFQRRALATADKWSRVIGDVELLIDAKRRLRKGLLQKLLTGKLRFPGFSGIWRQVDFRDIATLSKARHDPCEQAESFPCIELEHIAQGDGRLLGTVDSNNQNSTKAVFEKGDVLFGKLRPYLRKYLHCSFKGVCSTEIWVLNANRRLCSSEYLYRLVQSERFISAACVSTGSKMPRAEWSWVSDQPFLVPPLEEQRKITRFLSILDCEIAALCDLHGNLNLQKKGLLQSLLTGEVRVPLEEGRKKDVS